MPAVLRPPLPNVPIRRVLLLACAAALLVLLATAGVASADLLTPESGGSPNADRIDTLYKLVLVVAAVVFVGVEGALFYSLVKFRARKGAVPAQIRGNTRLEIGWTVGAAVVLVVLAVITFVKLDGIRTPDNSGGDGLQLANGVLTASNSPNKRLPPNGKSLNICVNGQQYVWRYTYSVGKGDCTKAPLDNPFTYTEMVVPTNTTVTLEIRAQDVIHSWWIPKLGGKFDAVPGYTNYTWFKIPKPGVYKGQCAELCGRNHANMIASVRAVSPQQYEAFIQGLSNDIEAANKDAAVQRKALEKQSGDTSNTSDSSATGG
jgi:cytochrome c oxidase subunit 2